MTRMTFVSYVNMSEHSAGGCQLAMQVDVDRDSLLTLWVAVAKLFSLSSSCFSVGSSTNCFRSDTIEIGLAGKSDAFCMV